MKVLVLASEPISASDLRAALEGGSAPQSGNGSEPVLEQAEVRIVAPALHASGLQFWLSDADEAIAKADAVWRASVAELDAAGVPAAGDTGEGEPMRAIEDALQSFDADRIVLFLRPESDQRYREELDAKEIERRFGRPVEQAVTA